MKIGSTTINNCKIGSTQVNEIRIGSTLVWQFSSVDPDAQAFITAAGITNPTQQTAINTLVVSLKANGIWTKMKAIYPFVGGTATTHKFNLKNPLDTNAAFRLVFNGGWTHSANGAQPNGTNAFAYTYLTPSTALGLNNSHLSFYSRTNSIAANRSSIGSFNAPAYTSAHVMSLKWSDNNSYSGIDAPAFTSYVNTNSTGLYIASRTANNSLKAYKNNSLAATYTTTIIAVPNTAQIYIGARNENNVPVVYDDKQCAFASIGDGLTDTDAANLYTNVQAFNTTLGRSVGPQTVSDADAQAFVTAANIQDQVQADAVNNLVIGLKADGLWTKMKAIYPFVGGDATSHKFNLKNPLDTDAAFRLTFSGGWTHSANGAQPNGTNGYADSFFKANVNALQNSHHLSYYSRTNSNNTEVEIGAGDFTTSGSLIEIRTSGITYYRINSAGTYITYSDTDSRAFYLANRTAANIVNGWRNSIKVGSLTTASTALYNQNIFLGAFDSAGNPSFFSTKQCAFASIGDGLTDTDAANLYTNVQAFQTALNRQV